MRLILLAGMTVLFTHAAGLHTFAQTINVFSAPPTRGGHLTSNAHASDTDEQGQEAFYKADVVQTIHLQIADVDQQKMLAALPECIYVPAQLKWNDQVLDQVGVRFKGNSSANPNQKHKRSYLIKFSKYKKQQRFLGMERISLDNGVQFGSIFSEPIITDILRELGHRTHRCNFAKLYLNDRFAGVYVNAERVDESFIDRNFPGKVGGLWKNDLGGPGGDLRYVGDDPRTYSKAFEPKNKEAESGKEITQLLLFIKQINQVPEEDFEQMLSQNLAVNDFLETTAVMLLSGAFDQLTGWGPHNFYLYREPEAARWHYLPWDLDVGFCEVAFGRIYVIEDWNAAWPIPQGKGNPLLERLIRNQNLLKRYRQIALDTLETYFKPQNLSERLDGKYRLIKDDLKDDPFPKRRVTSPTDENYDDIVDSMKTFFHNRYESAKMQLLNPGERPSPKQRLGAERPPQAMVQRFEKSVRKAEAMQRKLQEISRTMESFQRAIQQQKFAEAEKLLEIMERLTGDESNEEQGR